MVFFPEKGKKKKEEVGKKRGEPLKKKKEENWLMVVVEIKHLKTKSELITKSEIKGSGER